MIREPLLRGCDHPLRLEKVERGRKRRPNVGTRSLLSRADCSLRFGHGLSGTERTRYLTIQLCYTTHTVSVPRTSFIPSACLSAARLAYAHTRRMARIIRYRFSTSTEPKGAPYTCRQALTYCFDHPARGLTVYPVLSKVNIHAGLHADMHAWPWRCCHWREYLPGYGSGTRRAQKTSPTPPPRCHEALRAV